MNDVDRCLICGEVIPEGSQVCTACRNKYDIVTGETEEMAQELRDIADVLKITEGTDTNIRKSMESILRIADRLERRWQQRKTPSTRREENSASDASRQARAADTSANTFRRNKDGEKEAEVLQRERITIPPTAGTAAGRSGRKDKQHKGAPATPDKRKQPGYWLGETENEGGKEQ